MACSVPGLCGTRATFRVCEQRLGSGLGFLPSPWRSRSSAPLLARRIGFHQVRASLAPGSAAERLQSLSGVVSDENVPEGHSGLHGFLYGEAGAEVHGDGAAKEFQGREGEDDGTSVLELESYVSARESIKFPGVYAVYGKNKAMEYVGFSRNVVLSLKTHRTRAGEERCAFVRVKLFGDPSLVTKSRLEEEKQRWIRELEAVPPGNSPEEQSLWSSSAKVVETSSAKAKSMSESERREYEEKKLKLRKAMGENLHDDVDGEDEDAKLRRLKILQAVEGDNWSSVIDGQTMETVGSSAGSSSSDASSSTSSREVVSPFESSNTSSTAGSGLYSTETYDFTAENVDKVLDEVRPYLVADGGNVAVVSVADGTVSLELQGACGTCPSSTSTMKMGIERVLREKFGDAVKEVVDINRPSVTLTFEALNGQIDMLRSAIEGYGGVVQLATVDPAKGECQIKYKGPVPLGLGIKAAIRDKFPELNVVLIDP
ncbi:uncharacterized protein LOC9651475 [Selaginella moellendorffii]|nr:uncharacterized protein LOC9651475 [Selaginella moellendorffii]|eukprot:XP_002968899.2 uncharacterized protein LOC9651475 [Selaginella moellendorffii]